MPKTCSICEKLPLEPLSGRLKNGKVNEGIVEVCPVCDAPDKQVGPVPHSPLLISKENHGNV